MTHIFQQKSFRCFKCFTLIQNTTQERRVYCSVNFSIFLTRAFNHTVCFNNFIGKVFIQLSSKLFTSDLLHDSNKFANRTTQVRQKSTNPEYLTSELYGNSHENVECYALHLYRYLSPTTKTIFLTIKHADFCVEMFSSAVATIIAVLPSISSI